MPTRTSIATIVVLLATLAATAAEREPIPPYEINAKPSAESAIDSLVLASLEQEGLAPTYLCSDAVFIRRAFLDVIGKLPTRPEVRAFLDDTRAGKREALIDALLKRDEFIDYWTLKWCDLLRVKAEFPINLWPNGVQAYHRWIRDAVKRNLPYDDFVRALLTSSGSNFRVAPVNFYRAVQGHDPGIIADAVALTFMGARTEHWPKARRDGMAAFFSRLAFKPTAEWKEEIVYPNPAPTDALVATFPDGKTVRIPSETDPRTVFADWLLADGNPWFARNIANRSWAWFLGRGIIHEPDDIRKDNPPANPALLAHLEKELVACDYDLRKFFRVILTSGTYQQSSIPIAPHPKADTLAAQYVMRRIDAEVLMDTLCWVGGRPPSYSSAIPEPFTHIPEEHPTVALADGSITSSFLEMFGRPARDTGRESERNSQVTPEQRLYLINSSDVQNRIQYSRRLRGLLSFAQGNENVVVQFLYMAILSRPPVAEEFVAAGDYCRKVGVSTGAQDLLWTLLNSKEFLYKH